MWARGILRLVHKKLVELGVKRYEASPLASGESFAVEEYIVSVDSVILQPPGMPDVGRYRGYLRIAPVPWRRFCRWHSGPLDRRDEPWRRIYCTAEVSGEYEYCRQHRRSERFLYDLCMGLRGERALEACRELDRRVRAEYAVYLIVQQGGRVKVGSTRAWRVLERISEQPHAIGTVLAVYSSAYQARRAEMTVASAGIASEHRPRSRRQRLPAPGPAAARLSKAAEEAAKLLGVEWRGELVRVKPPEAEPRPVDPARLGDYTVRVEGYWGGLLKLAPESGGWSVWVDERALLHRDALLYTEDLLTLGS